jgi:hypothetical protein
VIIPVVEIGLQQIWQKAKDAKAILEDRYG